MIWVFLQGKVVDKVIQTGPVGKSENKVEGDMGSLTSTTSFFPLLDPTPKYAPVTKLRNLL